MPCAPPRGARAAPGSTLGDLAAPAITRGGGSAGRTLAGRTLAVRTCAVGALAVRTLAIAPPSPGGSP